MTTVPNLERDDRASLERDDRASLERNDRASLERDDRASLERDDRASLERDDRASLERSPLGDRDARRAELGRPPSGGRSRKSSRTFSGDAKDEIARVRFEKKCCPVAFMRALVRCSNLRPSTRIVATERGAVARTALAAAKAAGVRATAKQHRVARLGPHTIFEVVAETPLAAAPRAPGRTCCRRAWLRGAFLACGSVTDPTRGYHLEFFCRDDASARALCEGLASFGIDAAVTRRRGRPLAYVKGGQAVADLLGQMGATQAVFTLDNVRALRQTKNAIRRAVNSDAANAARAAASSARQCAAAVRAIRKFGLSKLSATLGQAAQLRIANPDLTLAELGARARPSVTKSTMGYRMRALESLAKGVRRASRGRSWRST